MDKLKMHTPNLTDENFKKLAALFPNAVTETINEKVKANHYSSVAWRNEAVQHSAVFALTALDEMVDPESLSKSASESFPSIMKSCVFISPFVSAEDITTDLSILCTLVTDIII